jgi:hypothetical protein
MSLWGYRVSVKLIVTAVVVVLLGVFAVAVTRPEPREIRLVAKGMAFYLEDGDLPNPTIFLKPGERVRVVLSNQDRGLRHDFAVPSLNAALDPLTWNRSDDVVFEAPAEPGIYEYWCRPHMTMMRGKIVVQD